MRRYIAAGSRPEQTAPRCDTALTRALRAAYLSIPSAMASSPTPRALVTGGCGFVGRALVRDLVRDRYEVWVLDNLFTGQHPDAWLPGFAAAPDAEGMRYENASGARVVFVHAEVVDRLRRETDVAGTLPAFDEVYHLAAVVGGRAVLIEQDPMLVATNHVIDASFFQWAVRRRETIGRILYASSSVAYPKALQ